MNLIVGANNSGKTAVLEAIAVLGSGGDPMEIYRSLGRRREFTDEDSGNGSRVEAVDVRQLFHGRNLSEESEVRLKAVATDEVLELKISVPRVEQELLTTWRKEMLRRYRRRNPIRHRDLPELEGEDRLFRNLRIEGRGEGLLIPLLPSGGLDDDIASLTEFERVRPVAFVTTAGVAVERLAALFEKIVITSEEQNVIAALNEVEPEIARIATRQTQPQLRRSFVVGLKGSSEPVPLGNLGDGVSRMLGIALSLVSAQGGYLLVDEIDTGLHHTVMRRMWRLIHETATRLNVTVFATTHSFDCVHALSEIASGEHGADISLLRVERNVVDAVHFSAHEIAHLNEWRIEAR